MLNQRVQLPDGRLGFADFKILDREGGATVALSGEWRILHMAKVSAKLNIALAQKKRQNLPIVVDFSALEYIDSSAILFFLRLKRENQNVKLYGFNHRAKALFRLVLAHSTYEPALEIRPRREGFFVAFGKLIIDKTKDVLAYSEFIGKLAFLFFHLFSRKNFRFAAMVKQIELSSVNALPIVAVTALLIGVVVTYQGSLQLQKFGAAIFAIDLVGMSITRELGPLLTAVVIAGRSGASYTSQIGVMKITEEIDAMKTMGFNPYYFLVFPRILALTLSLWLVILFADAVAILGSLIVANLSLGISYTEFFDRLYSSLALKHILVGLFKAPFFAFLIASIGIFRGFGVDKSSESIGEMTTHSVVNSIFAVVACDAIIAIICTRIGV